jgi:flagellar basal-body rod modification protein FlgD
MAVSSAIGSTSTAPATAATATSGATIAKNFDTFLTLLTTQLKNQNPLDPLDTNQFTQQLVQFAQVEQQIGMNSSLGALVSLQQTAQTTAAVGFLGATVRIDGDTAQLSGGKATWSFTSDKAATATINITAPTGELVYTETRTIPAGAQNFTWNGHDANGNTLPDGSYKLSIVAKDASGQPVAVSPEIEGVVDGIDMSKSPPLLSIGGQTFTLDKIKQVRRPTT